MRSLQAETGPAPGQETEAVENGADGQARKLASAPWSRFFYLFSWLLILSPSLLYVVNVHRFASLPANDYYGLINQLGRDDGYSVNPRDYLALKSNEHTVALPAMIYVLNARLSGGDNRVLSAFGVGLMGLVWLVFYRWLPAPVRGNIWARLVAGTALAIFVFTPVAVHNIALGFSSTMWCLSNLFCVLAMASLGRRRWWQLWPVLAFGLLGTLTYSTSISLWPALLVGAASLRMPWRRQVLVLAVAVVVVTGYLGCVDTPEHHPELNTHPTTVLAFLAVYLGNPFSADKGLAMAWGGLGLAITLIIVIAAHRRGLLPLLAPWLMLQVFCVSNGLGTAIARSGNGLEQAMVSRYGTLQGFFWIGLLAGLATALRSWQSPSPRLRWIGRALALAVLLVVAALHYHRGIPMVRGLLEKARRTPLAALAMSYKIPDRRAFSLVSPNPHMVYRVCDFLRANGHVPFDRPLPGIHGTRIAPALLVTAAADELTGEFTSTTAIDGGFARVLGWVRSPRPVGQVLILDSTGTVCGEAFPGFRSPRGEGEGWEGLLLGNQSPGRLTAYVRLAGDESLYRLAGEGRWPCQAPSQRQDR